MNAHKLSLVQRPCCRLSKVQTFFCSNAIPGTLRGRNIRISLNGLPPGTPVIIGVGGFFPAADIVLNVQFVELDPMGLYPILIETDVDGDGQFDTLAPFDVENTVVTPPTLHISRGDGKVGLDWEDEGEGTAVQLIFIENKGLLELRRVLLRGLLTEQFAKTELFKGIYTD